MPSHRKQHNVVLDEQLEALIWELVGEQRATPTKIIRALLATHPEIVARARQHGFTLQPDSLQWGGKRGNPDEST